MSRKSTKAFFFFNLDYKHKKRRYTVLDLLDVLDSNGFTVCQSNGCSPSYNEFGYYQMPATTNRETMCGKTASHRPKQVAIRLFTGTVCTFP